MTRWLLCLPFLLFFAYLYPRPVEPVPDPIETRVENGDNGLPGGDPVRFMQQCLAKVEKEVHGYRAVLYKREKVNGTLQPLEVIKVAFRAKPHSVYMRWEKGGGLKQAVLYVEGQYDNKLLVLPPKAAVAAARLFGRDPLMRKSLDDPLVKNSGRISIDQFGMQKGMRTALESWVEAAKRGQLHVKFEGLFQVEEVGNRLCYKLHRTGYLIPEEDNEAESIFYIDKETCLQVGSLLRDDKGNLIAEYYFRDIELNPEFPRDYFSEKLLR